MADVTVTLGAKDTGLQNALKKTQSSVTALKPAMAGIAAAGAAAFAGLAIAAAGVKKALDLGGTLSDVAGQTGMTAGRVMLLQTAFEQAGIGADQVGPAINKMQRALSDAASGTGPAAEAIARLGLNATDLANMSPDQAFSTLGEAINAIGNPTQRAAAAMEIFGRSGGKMLTLFGDSGALATAADTLGQQAGIMDRNAAIFDRTSDLINASSNKLQGVFVGMAESIAPAILPLLERFNQMDFSRVGQQMGEAASMFIAAITDGSIWQVMGDSATIALGNASNFLGKTLFASMNAAVVLFRENIQNAVTFLSFLTQPSFWKGMLEALKGAALTFGVYLLRAVADMLSLLNELPALAGRFDSALSSAIGMGDSLAESARTANAGAGNTLAPFLEQANARTAQTLTATRDAFQTAFDQAPEIDLSATQDRLNSNLDRLAATVRTSTQAAQAAIPAPNTAGLRSAFGTLEDPTAATGARPANQPLFASSLAKIGGGGGIAGSPGALLDESRKQTLFLKRIADGITRLGPQPLLA